MRRFPLLLVVALVAAVVIAVDLAASSPAFDPAAVRASCLADAESVQSAADDYHMQTAQYPGSIAALTNGGSNGVPWLRSARWSTDAYLIRLSAGGDAFVVSRTGRGGGDYAVTGPSVCDV